MDEREVEIVEILDRLECCGALLNREDKQHFFQLIAKVRILVFLLCNDRAAKE